MIRCKIYSCRRYPYQPCCLGCTDTDCPDRCKNSPSRCKCAADGALPQDGRKRRQHGRPNARKLDWNEIWRLHHEVGWNAIRIAMEMATTPTYIRRILRKLEDQGGDGHG